MEILLVASYYGNRDKLQSDGPLGSYTDFAYTTYHRKYSDQKRSINATTVRRTIENFGCDTVKYTTAFLYPVWLYFLWSGMQYYNVRLNAFRI